jgi:hypothetical protein
VRAPFRTIFLSLALVLVLGGGNTALADYKFYESDRLEVRSGDGKARAVGAIRWFHGAFPRGYIHRGDHTSKAKVRAVAPVGCIWAKVTFGYPNGSLTVGPGGPSGGIDGGSYAGRGYYVSCRKRGRLRPRRLSLHGIGYAKAFLNSSTTEACTSRSKKQGPRFCSFEKNLYGGS